MAQTFNDFIVECEMYPYSKQNFEIIKECEEISLLSKMLENHYVLQELPLDSVQFESTSYMTESSEQIQLIEESVKDKLRSLANKILKIITDLLDKVARFIQRKSDKLKAKMISNETITRIANLSDKEREKLITDYEKRKNRKNIVLKFNKKGENASNQKVSILKSVRALLSANAIMNEAADVKVDANGSWDEYIKTIKSIENGSLTIAITGVGPVPTDLENLIAILSTFDTDINNLSVSDFLKANKSTKDEWAGKNGARQELLSDKYNEYTFKYDVKNAENQMKKINSLKESIKKKIDQLGASTVGASGDASTIKLFNIINSAYSIISQLTANALMAETTCTNIVAEIAMQASGMAKQD